MDVINGLAETSDVFVEIDANAALGAPDDPTSLPIQITYSPTRRLAGDPSWQDAVWQSDPHAIPTRRWAKGTVVLGQLDEGVWYPFVKIVVDDPDSTIIDGKPFRVQGGPDDGPVDSDISVAPDGDHHRAVFVSADEFATLFTNPVVLIPRVAGKIIIVDQIVVRYVSDGGAWSLDTGSSLYAIYGPGPPTVDNTALSGAFPALPWSDLPIDRVIVATPILMSPTVDAAVGNDVALAEVTGDPQALNVAGDITIANPGFGYLVGDVLDLSNVAGDRATIEVDTVDGGGAIVTFHVVNPGQGYFIQGGVASLSGGSGSNATANYAGFGTAVGELHIDAFYRLLSV